MYAYLIFVDSFKGAIIPHNLDYISVRIPRKSEVDALEFVENLGRSVSWLLKVWGMAITVSNLEAYFMLLPVN